MHVVGHDDKAEEQQSLFLPAIVQTVDDDFEISIFFEHALPVHDGVGAEVHPGGFRVDFVAAHGLPFGVDTPFILPPGWRSRWIGVIFCMIEFY